MRHFDIDSVLQKLAERRIEEAMRQGKFDNLPGRGQPCEIEPMPADENARMVWWALRLTRNAGQTPEAVRLRRQVESLKDELSQATTEPRVRALVGAINSIVRQVNTLPREVAGSRLAPVDLGRELGRLHHRVGRPDRAAAAAAAAGLAACSNALCASANPSAARFCRRCGTPIGVC